MTVSAAGADNDEDNDEDTNYRLSDNDNACTDALGSKIIVLKPIIKIQGRKSRNWSPKRCFRETGFSKSALCGLLDHSLCSMIFPVSCESDA
jgi:hypothetical protein